VSARVPIPANALDLFRKARRLVGIKSGASI
jgi:hypothetical protein